MFIVYRDFYLALERGQGVQTTEGAQKGETKTLEMTFSHTTGPALYM